MMAAQASRLPGNRLHLHHGPIDLVIGAEGEARAVERAYAAAWDVFPAILPQLVAELPLLRAPVSDRGALPLEHPARTSGPGPDHGFQGPRPLAGLGAAPRTAQRMLAAVWPYAQVFITPMAAVAGSVAEEVLAAMTAATRLDKAYVNNGGDIAIHLAPGASISVGVVADVTAPAIDARTVIRHGDPVRGIATSGWRGRSHSLGIADAVTVLAATASMADAAATIVANAVDADHPSILRRPARDVKLDSDLGAIPVTVDVGPLPPDVRRAALEQGLATAGTLIGRGLIVAAHLALQGETRVAGEVGSPGIDHVSTAR